MAEVERYIGEYKEGRLNAPQLIVNIDYITYYFELSYYPILENFAEIKASYIPPNFLCHVADHLSTL